VPPPVLICVAYRPLLHFLNVSASSLAVTIGQCCGPLKVLFSLSEELVQMTRDNCTLNHLAEALGLLRKNNQKLLTHYKSDRKKLPNTEGMYEGLSRRKMVHDRMVSNFLFAVVGG